MESEKPEGAKVPCSALLGELLSDFEIYDRHMTAVARGIVNVLGDGNTARFTLPPGVSGDEYAAGLQAWDRIRKSVRDLREMLPPNAALNRQAAPAQESENGN